MIAFIKFFIAGVIIMVIAIPISIIYGIIETRDTIICPECRGSIRKGAKICMFCGNEINKVTE